MSRPLTIIVGDAAPARLHAALTLAAAAAALGRGAALFFHGGAVTALARGKAWPAEPGLATIAELFGIARELGVAISACQTGLAANGLGLADLIEGVAGEGMVAVLGRWPTAELVLA